MTVRVLMSSMRVIMLYKTSVQLQHWQLGSLNESINNRVAALLVIICVFEFHICALKHLGRLWAQSKEVDTA